MGDRKRKIRFLSLLQASNFSDFENIRGIFSFLVGAVTTVGISFIFLYIIFIINWIPIGLSLSDALGFLILAVGFGLIFIAIYSPFYFRDMSLKSRFKSRRINEEVILIFLISLILFFQLFNYFELNRYSIKLDSKIVLIFLFFFPFLPLIFRNKKIGAGRKRNILYLAHLFSIITVAYIFTEMQIWRNVTNVIGLTRQNVIIKLSAEQYEFAEAGIKKLNLNTKICTDKKEKIIFPVNILWHGIGNYSLVEIGEYPKNSFRIEVKNDESKVIYVDKNTNSTISIKC